MIAAAGDFGPANAEIFVACMACAILLTDLWLSERNRFVVHVLSLVTLAGATVLTLANGNEERLIALSGAFVADRVGDLLKLVTYLAVGVCLVYSRSYLRDRSLYRGEYYVLALFGMLGIMVMISAHSFLSLYLGLELLSLSLYAMVAFSRESPLSAEAAMKYFVLGAIASGTLLYGMSMLYGASGTLNLTELAAALGTQDKPSVVLLFALSFVLVGLAFKFGAVPFHMWLPDVYDGAPTAVTLYIGTAAKIASFALMLRLLVEGLGGLISSWQDMLAILAVLSMAIGNLTAIAQTNIKRMLAYSAISHVGFLLLGFLAGGSAGTGAALFYTVSYVIMALGGFGMIILLSRAGFEADRLDDFRGLNARSPWFAGMMLILMFGMAGVPPFLGFYAKVAVIAAVVDEGFLWLAIAAVAFSVVGAFYYLRVVKLMYFDAPQEDVALEGDLGLRVVLSANSLAVLGLGLFPAGLLALCAAAIG
ncbi:MAG: NADH-quinone oxidoreductase subunit NuoN [Pseudomonadota bacterium]